jgi:hypothetical protein
VIYRGTDPFQTIDYDRLLINYLINFELEDFLIFFKYKLSDDISESFIICNLRHFSLSSSDYCVISKFKPLGYFIIIFLFIYNIESTSERNDNKGVFLDKSISIFDSRKL